VNPMQPMEPNNNPPIVAPAAQAILAVGVSVSALVVALGFRSNGGRLSFPGGSLDLNGTQAPVLPRPKGGPLLSGSAAEIP
jgi:8-oxo-dGTP pyrophosphatase MutT (NUDIX family)